MGREGIGLEQVAAAADALVGEGQQPSIRAVRERLGTGSMNTIQKHLSAWRASRPSVAPVHELPPALSAAIAAEIERAAARVRADYEARLEAAQGEAAELATAGEMIEGERDAMVEQVARLTRERDTLVHAVRALQSVDGASNAFDRGPGMSAPAATERAGKGPQIGPRMTRIALELPPSEISCINPRCGGCCADLP